MAKVVRQRSRVVAIVGELVAHRVPQHLRVLRMVQRTGKAAPDRFLRSSGAKTIIGNAGAKFVGPP